MYYPSLDEVCRLRKYGNLVPVYHEIMADLETPVSAYLKIAGGNYSFLLESVEGGERIARYSFIGTEPSLILKTKGENPVDPLLLVEKELSRFQLVPTAGLPRFQGGMVGYLSYEVARHFERLPSPDHDPLFCRQARPLGLQYHQTFHRRSLSPSYLKPRTISMPAI